MHRKLKVAHLSDMPLGGAAVAANRLVQDLAASSEVCVERWVFGKKQVANLLVGQVALEKNYSKTFLERFVRVFSCKGAKALQRIRQRKALLRAVAIRKPDILHLHNLHAAALRHEDLLAIPRDVRIVWTMHDEWPFAPWAYKWRSANGADEIQGSEQRREVEALAARRQFFDTRKDSFLVSPSHWLAENAKKSIGANLNIAVIPHGVPTDVFAPTSKLEAKAALGLDTSKTWLGLAAASFDRRKGADIFMEAFGMLCRNDLAILIWGAGKNLDFPHYLPHRSAGYVYEEKHQALLYSACDLFVCPSRSEAFGLVALESISCGTPVVASKVGGLPDIVRPSQTGWLYTDNTARACAETLNEALLNSEQWPAYHCKSREIAEREFSSVLNARKYLDLYFGIIPP